MSDIQTHSTLPPVPHSISPMYSLLQRLRSLRHGFWYAVSERIRWSRGAYEETPVRELHHLARGQAERIAALCGRYQVQFELRMNAATSIINYEYLDILDRAWSESGMARHTGGVLHDVGCASFWYAATLQAFFQPARMVGVEVEGHRLFRDARTRSDYAAGYLRHIPNAQFVVADYAHYQAPADSVTAWFPFVTAPALLAWRLPLSLLAPQRLFGQIRHNLAAHGVFLMANHGFGEAAEAQRLCTAAGLQMIAQWSGLGPFSAHRDMPPVLSWWMHP